MFDSFDVHVTPLPFITRKFKAMFRHIQKCVMHGQSCCLADVNLSHDITAAMLVSQNNETAAMLVSQTSPRGVQLFSHANDLFCFN